MEQYSHADYELACIVVIGRGVHSGYEIACTLGFQDDYRQRCVVYNLLDTMCIHGTLSCVEDYWYTLPTDTYTGMNSFDRGKAG